MSGLKLTLEMQVNPDTGSKNGKLKAELKTAAALLSLDTDLNLSGPIINTAAVLGKFDQSEAFIPTIDQSEALIPTTDQSDALILRDDQSEATILTFITNHRPQGLAGWVPVRV